MDGLRQHAWPAFAAGTMRPVIDSQFEIQEAEAAHARVASNETFGKVVLTVA
jgi:NADPH:quinone reductase-like Zn-dependent oxidoreductase